MLFTRVVLDQLADQPMHLMISWALELIGSPISADRLGLLRFVKGQGFFLTNGIGSNLPLVGEPIAIKKHEISKLAKGDAIWMPTPGIGFDAIVPFGALVPFRTSRKDLSPGSEFECLAVDDTSSERIFDKEQQEFLILSAWWLCRLLETRRASEFDKKRAETDSMTRLLNQREIINRICLRLDKFNNVDPRPFSVFIIDIDRFKQVNDKYGHPMGDRVIIKLAELLRARAKLGLIGRYGGEEFLGYFDLPLDEADAELRRLLANFHSQRFHKDRFRCTFSGGMIEVNVDYLLKNRGSGREVDIIYQNVDALLYEAKRQGRNRIITGT